MSDHIPKATVDKLEADMTPEEYKIEAFGVGTVRAGMIQSGSINPDRLEVVEVVGEQCRSKTAAEGAENAVEELLRLGDYYNVSLDPETLKLQPRYNSMMLCDEIVAIAEIKK